MPRADSVDSLSPYSAPPRCTTSTARPSSVVSVEECSGHSFADSFPKLWSNSARTVGSPVHFDPSSIEFAHRRLTVLSFVLTEKSSEIGAELLSFPVPC